MIPVISTFEFRGLSYDILYVPGDDGTPLAVYRTGPSDGPVVLLANGIGVGWYGMDPLARALTAAGACVLGWDQRGLGGSVPLCSPDVSMSAQAADVLAILEHFAPGQAVAAAGWSMGVPVLVETHRRINDRFTRLALLFGAPGRPFLETFSRPLEKLLVGLLGEALKHPALPLVLNGALNPLEPAVREFLYVIGFTGRRCDPELFEKCTRGVLSHNPETYGRTLLELCRHDGWDHLPHMKLPAYVTGGTADWVTPCPAMERTANLLPDARYEVIPDASHFALLENHPGLIGKITDFLANP